MSTVSMQVTKPEITLRRDVCDRFPSPFEGGPLNTNKMSLGDLNDCDDDQKISMDPSEQSLLSNLKLFLLFGKFTGLVPIQGLFQNNPAKLQSNCRSFSSVLNLGICLFLVVNAVVGLVHILRNTTDVQQLALTPGMLIFYSNGVFLHFYFNRRGSYLINILKEWDDMKLYYTLPDVHLYRDVNFVAGFILTSAILENVVGHLNLFPVNENSGLPTILESLNSTVFETYYNRSHDAWAKLVPYSPPLAIYVFVSNKLSLYCWNFMDIIIAVLARALYFKFMALYLQAKANITTINKYDQHKWRQVVLDHHILLDMLKIIQEFLSPLVFVSYALNVYYICIQLQMGLTSSSGRSFIATTYAVWSFLHLGVRFLTISIYGARLNDWAHRLKNLVQSCPKEVYILEVERMERYLSVNQIGLTGLDCFIITKSLILQIVSVVFTLEIFLLQSAQTPVIVTSLNIMRT